MKQMENILEILHNEKLMFISAVDISWREKKQQTNKPAHPGKEATTVTSDPVWVLEYFPV